MWQELWMRVDLRGFCIGAAYGPLLLIHSVVRSDSPKRGYKQVYLASVPLLVFVRGLALRHN